MASFVEGKICLVTGGICGIGRKIAEQLLSKGAKVFIGDILEDRIETCKEELALKFNGSNILVSKLDVTSKESFASAISKCIEHFGSIDILVNNAGLIDEVNYEKTMAVNFDGAVRGCKLAMEHMKSGSAILNVASIAGLLSDPFMPVYFATKAGIVSLTRCLGHPLEFDKHGIRVMCICPNFVATSLWDGIGKWSCCDCT